MSGQGLPSVRESRIEKRLEDRVMWILLLGSLPLIYLASQQSLRWLILLQAYLLTATFGGILLVKERRELRRGWFWRAVVCVLPVHVAAIVGIFYWDKANVEIAFKGFYTVGAVWLVGLIELFVVVAILEFWRTTCP